MGSTLAVRVLVLQFVMYVLVAGLPAESRDQQPGSKPQLTGGSTLLRRIARNSHRTYHFHNHVLDHIYHEVQKGHVTDENLHHWFEQINHELNEGHVTTAQVSDFMAHMHQANPSLFVPGDGCCMLG